MQTSLPGIGPRDGATFSPDQVYRYELWRELGGDGKGTVVFCMLNPSTATETTNDPTVRRCISFARRWGFGRLVVVNIFALRSTDPKFLRAVDDPIGPENDQFIIGHASAADRVICAWGKHAGYLDRGKKVLEAMRAAGVTPHALRVNKDGSPQHPLYIPDDTEPFPIG